MSFRASHRFARISPQKVRPIANLIRGKFVAEALDILKFQPHRGARMLEKVLNSAVANAQDPDQNPGQMASAKNLVVSLACVDPGPMFRRMQPRARGMAFIIKKRMSHIRIEVESIDNLVATGADDVAEEEMEGAVDE